jgi:hypothetical protein
LLGVCVMSSSPKASSFNPAEWYSLASWLFDTKPVLSSQCLRRTIIGRAYYAALICAREATGSKTVGQGGHENVVKALRGCNSTAAGKLDSLRLKRQSADYFPDKDVTVRDVEISLMDSRTILNALGKMPPDIPPHNKPYPHDYLDSSKFLAK